MNQKVVLAEQDVEVLKSESPFDYPKKYKLCQEHLSKGIELYAGGVGVLSVVDTVKNLVLVPLAAFLLVAVGKRKCRLIS